MERSSYVRYHNCSYLSIYLFICLFIYLFIYLFIIKIYFMLTLVYNNLAVILHQEMATDMLICVVTDTR